MQGIILLFWIAEPKLAKLNIRHTSMLETCLKSLYWSKYDSCTLEGSIEMHQSGLLHT